MVEAQKLYAVRGMLNRLGTPFTMSHGELSVPSWSASTIAAMIFLRKAGLT
jgi:hypothetical protein